MSRLEEIIQLTEELIRIPSMHSRPEEIRRCSQFVLDWCARRGIKASMILHDGIPSILVMPETKSVDLLLMTHLDVVDAPDALFHPRRDGDRLFGRGAIDDKYAVALSLVLYDDCLQRVRSKGETQNALSLGLLITGDEETGGEHGAGQALKGLRASYALALDGGSPGRIIIREKGVLDLRLTAHGKAAHGARPWLGINPIDILLEDYAMVRVLFPDLGGDHWHRTVNFGKIRAGHSTNQVPQTAQGWFNIRFTEHDDPTEILEEIRTVVRSEVEVLGTIPVFASNPSPLTDQLLAVAPDAILTKEHGASDAQYLMARGIPGAIWGAEGFGTQHTEQECVSIASIRTLFEHLRTFFMQTSGLM